MTTNPSRESGPDDGPDDAADADADGPIVESSTIQNATVTIHSHPTQQPVDIVTETVDVQILVEECYLNGVSYLNPIRSLTIEDVTATHNPVESVLSIRT